MFITLFAFSSLAQAQEVENDYQSRAYAEMSYKPFKKLKLKLIPEIRLDEDFSIGKYLLETEAIYKPRDFFSVGAAYRFVINPRETKSTEYFHRFAVNASVSKKVFRFDPALRFSYSNYADDETTDKEFFRYKASVKYDIKSCKLTPSIAAEAFQQLTDNGLYKMRYTLGVDYKVKKNNYIGLSYKLDYYKNELRNRHIISLGYKIKF
jgi:hypothetical protein